MANVTYTVQKGDTLSKIAAANNTTVDKLVELNKLADPNYIVVGQVLIISGKATTVKKNTSKQAKIQVFGLQSDTTSTMYAVWTWDKTNTENYQVRWYYDTGDGVWFEGSMTDVTTKQSTYSAPENANKVKFTVRPVSKKRTVNKKETSYWTAEWSTAKIYDFINNPPSVPPVPTVTIEDNKLTAKVENLDVNATAIHFKVVQDDETVFKTSNTSIRTATNSAQYACYVTLGSSYKVACRSARGTVYSDWSDFSAAVETIPNTPTGFTTCKANSDKSVYLEWEQINTADTYDIEYADKIEYFDNTDQTSTKTGIEFTHFEVTGLEKGATYSFRVRAVNKEGESGWSAISSIPVGKEPAAPTTWSSTTTAITGEAVNLYWVHNSADESSQTKAEIELITNGVTEVIQYVNDRPEDEKDKTSMLGIQTDSLSEGDTILWRVRTAGASLVFGEWSIQRTVDVYAMPTLAFDITDVNGNSLDNITSFPFYISALAGPKTQAPIGYHVTVTADEMYETVDDIGNTKIVAKGESVFSKYFDINSALKVEFSANNIDLVNNGSYTVTCVVTMNSGLNAEASTSLTVAWDEMEYEPSAEIGIDPDVVSAHIRPYCEDENGDLIPNLYLSVYRREFDGSFTEIIKNVDNTDSLFVTDPHPSLDYARYRIVATSKLNGAVSYSDAPGYPVGETGVIIQWDEDWSYFDTTNEDAIAEPSWSGSMLRLPYNIDVSNNHNADVSMIEYVGRKRPVSYYGTHLGESATWNMVIPKNDKDTLYALRRLSIWMGDVYVREPSGSGYWANISVSFSQKHRELTIPVTLNVTPVEGGM